MQLTSILDAAYSLEGTDGGWLHRLAEACLPELPADRGLIACIYDATDPGWIHTRAGTMFNIDFELVRRLHAVPVVRGKESHAMVDLVRSGAVTTLRRGIRDIEVCREHYEPLLRSEGLRDILYVNAADPTHHGCLLIVPSVRGKWAPRTAHRWRRIAAHIAASMRVRGNVDRPATAFTSGMCDEGPLTEAILSPSGRLEHATASTDSTQARATLRRAVLARDAARSSQHVHAPEEALAMWQALIAGRWSLVDRFDADGRRYVVARRNDPDVGDPRGLSIRERQILSYAALGHSNKLIAYELGIASSTVAVHLTRAKKKLAAFAPDTPQPEPTNSPTQ
jgi:hypothetical protein